ncbi:hypothetical protein TNCV_3079661 [Trichonephila clavipes]|nr:hypothetical protein TNCV_3079661 [Trichonephila clavipes]
MLLHSASLMTRVNHPNAVFCLGLRTRMAYGNEAFAIFEEFSSDDDSAASNNNDTDDEDYAENVVQEEYTFSDDEEIDEI